MGRGKTLGVEARSLNVKVDVEDIKTLQLLQIVTGRPTADVVRQCLKHYIEENKHRLAEAAQILMDKGKD